MARAAPATLSPGAQVAPSPSPRSPRSPGAHLGAGTHLLNDSPLRRSPRNAQHPVLASQNTREIHLVLPPSRDQRTHNATSGGGGGAASLSSTTPIEHQQPQPQQERLQQQYSKRQVASLTSTQLRRQHHPNSADRNNDSPLFVWAVDAADSSSDVNGNAGHGTDRRGGGNADPHTLAVDNARVGRGKIPSHRGRKDHSSSQYGGRTQSSDSDRLVFSESRERENSVVSVQSSDRSVSMSETSVERSGIAGKIFSKESKHVFQLSWPVSLGYLIQMLIPMGQIYSMGHMEKATALAGTALALTVCNVTGQAIGLGLNTGLDTLCSQAYTGSSDPHALGKHLQRAIAVLCAVCIPVWALWLNLEPILLLCQQPPESSAIAASVAQIMCIGLFPTILNDALKRYLQCQGIVVANLCVVLIATPISFFLQWLLVWSPWFQLGHQGGALATSLTYILITFMTMAYITFIDGYQCWGGFSRREMFNRTELIEYLKLAIPGMFMTCTEWWAFEALVLAAGLFGDQALGAQTILIQTASLTYTLPFGISIGATTRVGNLLGQSRPITARAASIVSLILAVVVAIAMSAILMIFRRVWANWWSNDNDVADLVYEILPLLLSFQFFDSLNAVSSGILRGSGKQSFGAGINLVGYYVMGLPLSVYLSFGRGWRISGLWTGMLTGVMAVATIQIVAITCLDWKREANIARKRLDEAEAISQEIESIEQRESHHEDDIDHAEHPHDHITERSSLLYTGPH